MRATATLVACSASMSELRIMCCKFVFGARVSTERRALKGEMR